MKKITYYRLMVKGEKGGYYFVDEGCNWTKLSEAEEMRAILKEWKFPMVFVVKCTIEKQR